MRDYIRRFIIAGIMAICVSLLFFGVKYIEASTNVSDLTANWMWPSDGIITDSFGTRYGHHKGIDIAAPFGSTIYAVDNGIVSKSYYSDTYGNVVFIKHDNQIETVYAHLQERLVQEGSPVQRGAIIGKMGNTGDSSGVHLHFEVHLNEWTFDKKNAINPMLALGEVRVGQAVAAVQKDQSEHALETAARLASQANNVDNNDAAIQRNGTIGATTVHIVQTGETLWSIAKQHHASISLIQKQNSLQTDQIVIGQKLTVPVETENIYVVQKGDTLEAIARKTNVSVAKLTDINGLKGDLIKPQQELTLPK